MTVVKGAVVQAGTVLLDKERTLQKLGDLTADAARQGAALVVFPEAFIGGYPKGIDFGARLGLRTDEGRETFRRYFEGSISVPGSDFDRIALIAETNRVHLVVGVIERDGGTLYCTVLIFGPDGTFFGKHRKIMPTAMERLVWGYGDGSTLIAPHTDLGVLAPVICWENYMPAMRMAMYAKGVEFYCAPTVDDREVWAAHMRTISVEGRCFVLSACQVLHADAAEPFRPDGFGVSDVPGVPLIRGGSCIIAPRGTVLAGPVYDEEAILVADMDKADLPRGKYDFDAVGHYARPDIFQLHVNEGRNDAVSFYGSEPDWDSDDDVRFS